MRQLIRKILNFNNLHTLVRTFGDNYKNYSYELHENAENSETTQYWYCHPLEWSYSPSADPSRIKLDLIVINDMSIMPHTKTVFVYKKIPYFNKDYPSYWNF